MEATNKTSQANDYAVAKALNDIVNGIKNGIKNGSLK